MSGMKHSNMGFQLSVDGLPLFDNCDLHKDVTGVQEDSRGITEQVLKSHYFESPIELNNTYSNSSLHENNRKVKFLGVVVDNSGNQGFAIEIDHDYQKEIRHSYTRGWKKPGDVGERATHIEYKRETGKKQYTIFSTWWRGEKQTHIVAYNGKAKRVNSKRSDILFQEGLRLLVIEMVNIASKKGLL